MIFRIYYDISFQMNFRYIIIYIQKGENRERDKEL